MTAANPTPAQRFATILFTLTQAVGGYICGNRLPSALITLIINRVNAIKHRVARIIARIEAGTYVPRRFSPRRKPDVQKPRPPGTPPQPRGWLLKLVPEAIGHRAWLETLFRDPEMAALLAHAPASLRRPIRSICWMLRIDPPQVLALPKRPKPEPSSPSPLEGEARGGGSSPPEPKPPSPPLPDWLKDRRKPWSLARIRGSPHRA